MEAEEASASGKEAFLLALHTFFLVLRTVLSVMVARLDGRIVRDLVRHLLCWSISSDRIRFLPTAKDSSEVLDGGSCLPFPARIPMPWYVDVVSRLADVQIRYLQSKLALAFRTRLTRYVHDLYLFVTLLTTI